MIHRNFIFDKVNCLYLMRSLHREYYTMLTFHFREAMQHNFVIEFHMHPSRTAPTTHKT